MPTPATPSVPTPAGDDRNLARAGETPAALSFEDWLRMFWQRNSKLITGLLLAVLIGIAANGAWEYLQAEKEKEIGQAYAAATTPAQWQAFVAAHPGHPLSGAAQLQLADQAYGNGNYTDAAGLYQKAIETLDVPALSSRARLGLAISKMQGGRAAEGETELKAFAADANEVQAFRAEAMYHLASYAVANGRAEEVQTYSEQLMQLDPTSPWAQRVMMLRASMPAPAVPAPATDADAPAITLPGLGK